MQHWKRLCIAAAIVLSGMALVPFIALPSETIGWQIFRAAYVDQPALAINATTGRPGSVFTVTGVNFPPNTQVQIRVNGRTVGALPTTAGGGLTFYLATAEDATVGRYRITVQSYPTAVTEFTLQADAPLVTATPQGVIFNIPRGFVGYVNNFPLIIAER